MLDDEDFDQLSPGARAAAEREMRNRDRMGPGGDDHLLYASDDDQAERRPGRRRGLQAGEDAADEEGDKIENIEDTKGFTLLEWVQKVYPSPRFSMHVTLLILARNPPRDKTAIFGIFANDAERSGTSHLSGQN